MTSPMPGSGGPSPSDVGEDRRKHLDFIQAIITRMSAASSQAKAWLLPVVTAAYGYALVKHADSVVALGMVAVALFAYLDANYLRQEKRFRCLYKCVAKGEANIEAFSLQPDDLPSTVSNRDKGDWPTGTPRIINRLIPGPDVWRSWSVAPFYGGLLLAGLCIAIRIWLA